MYLCLRACTFVAPRPGAGFPRVLGDRALTERVHDIL
jgi:hypothetical protein